MSNVSPLREPDVPVELPHSAEVEQQILAILMHPEGQRRFTAAAARLQPQHFHYQAHGDLYAQMVQVHGAGGDLSPVTLATAYRSAFPTQIEAEQFVRALGRAAITILNLDFYITRQLDLYTRRVAITRARDLVDELQKPASDTAKAIAGFTEVLRTAHSTSASRALDWAQLQALPEPEYLVKGIIDAGTLIEVYGPHSCGKSFLVTDLGLAVATGRDRWAGRRVRQSGVLYISAEGGSNIRRRMQAYGQHHGVDFASVPFFTVLAPTDLLSPSGASQIIADAGSVPELALIIVDTLARVTPGADENAVESMGALVNACDIIRERTGSAVLLVHHTGKAEENGSRGSSALPAAVDTLIAVKAEEDRPRVAELLKRRDGEIGPLAAFELRQVELGIDHDGDPLTSCIVDFVDMPKQKAAPKPLTAAARVALDTLHKAIERAGKPADPSFASYIPAGVTVVDMSMWRRFHYAGATSATDEKKEEARRKDFQRAREALLAARVIGVHLENVWIIG